MTDSDAWGVTIKVPEEVRDEVRQIVQEQAPGGTTYADCLLEGAKALADEPGGDVYDPVTDETLPDDMAQEIINAIAVEIESESGFVDDDAIARQVASRIDYSELANAVADELEGRMR